MDDSNQNPLSKSLCALPWSHLVVEGKTYRPCCRFGDDSQLFNQQSAEEALNGSYQENLRQQMLRGEKISGCSRCYEQDAASGESMRSLSLKKYPGAWAQPPKLQYLEYKFGNICNLKCRSCSSLYSSKWIQDEKALGLPDSDIAKLEVNSKKILDQSWNHLTRIKFLGGEPFLHPEHEEIILELDQKQLLPKMELDYATNGTVRVSAQVIEAWHKLKSLELCFSIDDFKEANDFFREGSRWQEVIENIHWYKKVLRDAPVSFNIHTVVNIYNVHKITELDNWLLSEFPDFWLSKDCIVHPSWLNISILPAEEKILLSEKYQELILNAPDRKRKMGYQQILKRLQQEPSPMDEKFSSFINYDRKLNELRGHSLSQVHPHLAKLVEAYS